MNHYPFPKSRITGPLIGGALLLLLLVTRDSMYSMMVWDFYTCQFLSLGIMGLLGLSFAAVNRKQLLPIVRDPRMVLIIIAVAAAAIPMAVKADWQLMYFSIIIGLVFAVFLSYFRTLDQTARWYVITMCVLGLWSILTAYLLRIPVDRGLVAMTPVTNNNGVEFFNFVFSIVPDTYVNTRNFGIFREPGVYQFFLIIALYLNNDILCWDREWKLWAVNGILALTLLTTFATGGMIEMCLLFAVLFFEKKWYRSKWILAGLGVLCVLGAAGVFYLVTAKNELYYTFLDMVAKFTRNPESVGSRLGSITMGIQIFLRSPLFGEPVTTVLHSMVDYSASTLILYNIFGILGGSLNAAGWFALVWKKERNVLVNLALLLVLFMAFNTQNLTWNLFFWLFPGMALAERGIPSARKLLSHKKA